MKIKEISALSHSELDKKIEETKFDLLQSKIKKTLGQLENPLYIRTLRRNIAKMKTIQNIKKLKDGENTKAK